MALYIVKNRFLLMDPEVSAPMHCRHKALHSITLTLILILSLRLGLRVPCHFGERHNCFFRKEQLTVSGRALVELILCKYEREGCTCQAGCGDKGWVAQYRLLARSTVGHGHGAEKLLQ